jgi:hypothetical protein
MTLCSICCSIPFRDIAEALRVRRDQCRGADDPSLEGLSAAWAIAGTTVKWLTLRGEALKRMPDEPACPWILHRPVFQVTKSARDCLLCKEIYIVSSTQWQETHTADGKQNFTKAGAPEFIWLRFPRDSGSHLGVSCGSHMQPHVRRLASIARIYVRTTSGEYRQLHVSIYH